MEDEPSKSDNTKRERTPEEETWESLTKEYLTVDQKLAIIREYNGGVATLEWNKTVAALTDYLEKRKK